MSPQGGSFLKWSKTTSADWLLAHLTFLFYRGGGTDKRYNVHFGSTKMLTILAFLVFHANGNELFTQISSAAETRQCASHKLVTVSNCGKRYEELSSPQDPAKKVSRGSFQFFPPFHRSTEVSTHFLIVFHPISESILVNMLQSENMQCTGKLKHFVYLFWRSRPEAGKGHRPIAKYVLAEILVNRECTCPGWYRVVQHHRCQMS